LSEKNSEETSRKRPPIPLLLFICIKRKAVCDIPLNIISKYLYRFCPDKCKDALAEGDYVLTNIEVRFFNVSAQALLVLVTACVNRVCYLDRIYSANALAIDRSYAFLTMLISKLTYSVSFLSE
jgi:hypothetical protein